MLKFFSMAKGRSQVRPGPVPSEKRMQKTDYVRELMNLKHFAIKYYNVGTYFGEEEIITQQKRKFHIKTATDCELMLLLREDFEKILMKEFPHIFNEIKKNALLRMEQMEIAKKTTLRNVKYLCR